MNKFKDFKLILDNSSGTYNAGETITGFVLVDLKKTIKLRGKSSDFFYFFIDI